MAVLQQKRRFKLIWDTGTLFLFCMMILHLPVLMDAYNTQVFKGWKEQIINSRCT